MFKDTTLESQFVVDHVHSAFVADSSSSTHPMTYEVYTPDEIQDMFDTISYAKAASVLRMVEKVFGKKAFYDALKGYLNKRYVRRQFTSRAVHVPLVDLTSANKIKTLLFLPNER